MVEQTLLRAVGENTNRGVKIYNTASPCITCKSQRRTAKPHGVIYYAHGNTDRRHWVVRDSFDRDSIPIYNYLNSRQAKIVFSLTLPYFKGTDLSKLVNILVEEQNLLSSLRRELKDIVKDFDEKENHIEHIRQSILRPELDKINKHFRNYKNAHKWGVAGSVAVFSLSLIKLFIPNDEINNFISSVMSGTGFTGLVMTERDYQSKMNSLRDNPYFLLWRVQRNPNI